MPEWNEVAPAAEVSATSSSSHPAAVNIVSSVAVPFASSRNQGPALIANPRLTRHVDIHKKSAKHVCPSYG